MLLRLRISLGVMLCLLVCLLAEGQNCTRWCHNLFKGEAWWPADGGGDVCYTYTLTFGADMYAAPPTGGMPVSPGPEPVYISRQKMTSCEELCPNWATAFGPRITDTGTKSGGPVQVIQQYCVPSQ